MLQQYYQPPPPPRCVIEKPKKRRRKKKSGQYDCGDVVMSANILLYKNTLK
jgi:hypothetical protein